MAIDHYAVLGLAFYATLLLGMMAYNKLTRRYRPPLHLGGPSLASRVTGAAPPGQHHPDKEGDTGRFREIMQSFEVLANEKAKATYDARREEDAARVKEAMEEAVRAAEQAAPDEDAQEGGARDREKDMLQASLPAAQPASQPTSMFGSWEQRAQERERVAKVLWDQENDVQEDVGAVAAREAVESVAARDQAARDKGAREEREKDENAAREAWERAEKARVQQAAALEEEEQGRKLAAQDPDYILIGKPYRFVSREQEEKERARAEKAEEAKVLREMDRRMPDATEKEKEKALSVKKEQEQEESRLLDLVASPQAARRAWEGHAKAAKIGQPYSTASREQEEKARARVEKAAEAEKELSLKKEQEQEEMRLLDLVASPQAARRAREGQAKAATSLEDRQAGHLPTRLESLKSRARQVFQQEQEESRLLEQVASPQAARRAWEGHAKAATSLEDRQSGHLPARLEGLKNRARQVFHGQARQARQE